MLTIREKTETDLDALRSLFLRVRLSTFLWLDTSEYKLSDFDEETKGELVLVAAYQENVIGFISLWPPESFIHHLYVDEKHQRRGTGKALLSKAVQVLESPVTLKCLDRNLKAIKFYKEVGFFDTGTGSSAEGPYTVLQFSKTFK